jgi:hypothetical protein
MPEEERGLNMKLSKIKIGELYKHPFFGIVMVKSLKKDFCSKGKLISIRSDALYNMYEVTMEKLVPVSDKDIKDFLLSQLGRFTIDNEYTVTIDDEYMSLFDRSDGFVLLNKKQALSLKEILNKELV